MKKNFLFFLSMVLGMIPSMGTNISVQTVVCDVYSQPPIVGGVIGNYNDSFIAKKGIIVSVSNDNLFYDVSSETTFPYYWTGQGDPSAADIVYSTQDYRVIDCSATGKEQFWCPLLFLQPQTYYFVRAYVVTADGNVVYGKIESLYSQAFSRYNGRTDYANVWHAFDRTLFDLVTDEIINPAEGFYYTTNENPKTVRHQVGTGYNTCYKFLTKWNYQLWYYHSMFCDQNKIVSVPLMSFSGNELIIEKNPLDAGKAITIYYSINGDFFRPETFTDIYTAPIGISDPCTVCCYAISSDGYISYTNMYEINALEEKTDIEKVPEVVDLGLTSGTLWASCNLGASSPEEFGDYFAWGETCPKENYNWSTYKFGGESIFLKYNSFDGLTELDLEDDAAYVILGRDWRMPTHKEELELVEECSWESVMLNGVSGYKITGPNGNSIFMPRGGLYDGTDYGSDGTTVSSANTCGWYWSSTLNTVGSQYAQGLCFFPSLIANIADHERCDGHNIRPVFVGDVIDDHGENHDDEYGIVADIVDLGLSVKWASWNLGASHISDYGGLYGIGDPTGERTNSSIEGYHRVKGECISGTEYDLATLKWGKNWRVPTIEQLKELMDRCTWESGVVIDGVKGVRATGPNGNQLFIPCAGTRHGTSNVDEGYIASLWSGNVGSSYYDGYEDLDLYFSGRMSVNGNCCYYGQTIRPVYIETIEPNEGDGAVSYEDGEFNEDTDLIGNTIGNIYYNISNENGEYSSLEGCIILRKPTSDEEMNELEGQDIFGEGFKNDFTGIVFMVQAGSGTVKVKAEAEGNMTLKVKIGNSAPITMELEGKVKVSFPYSVTEPTYVYIYGGETSLVNVRRQRSGSNYANSLKIYGIEWSRDVSAIASIHKDAGDENVFFNLSGQRVETPSKGIYIKNGKKVMVR